jgi:hypothetical protein
MSLFKKNNTMRCGAIIDIGSGSVGVAIVVSNDITKTLDIVWSERQYMLIKKKANESELLNEINTTLVTAFLELGSSGLKALHAFNPKLSIDEIQTTLSAPWSHTISQNITYTDEKPFIINEELFIQLEEKVRNQSEETRIDGKTVNDLGFRLITNKTTDVEINGYSIKNPLGKKSTAILISHIQSLGLQAILAVIEDSQEKILPKATIVHHSFMYLFYEVLKHLHPKTTDVCLIDITDEATEIAVVRDNLLALCTHTSVGLYSIAREIALSCSIPKEEAYSLLKDQAQIETYSDTQKAKIKEVLDAYENAVATLFTKAGGAFSTPETLFIHTSQNTEAFFSARIKNASKYVTGNDHVVHLVTSEVLQNKEMTDTAILLSAHYFHTKHEHALAPQ